jgi:hypothetical protein
MMASIMIVEKTIPTTNVTALRIVIIDGIRSSLY